MTIHRKSLQLLALGISLAISASAISDTPEQVQVLSEPITLTGTLTMLDDDDFVHRPTETLYEVEISPGHRISLRFESAPPTHLRTGMKIRVAGQFDGTQLTVGRAPNSLLVTATTAPASTAILIPPSLSIADVAIAEGDSGTKLATFTVKLSFATPVTVTYDIATSSGTATAGSDYVASSLSGQSIAAGATNKNFFVFLNGDATVETNETFNVKVSGVGWAQVSDGVALGTIVNDDEPVIAAAAGGYHTCAVTSIGSVKCWGEDGFGQLGNNGTTDSSLPVAVSGLSSGVVAVTASAEQTCALTNSGAVKCWGQNNYGQLGNNSTVDSLTPVAVSGLSSGVAAIATDGDHACALTSGGVVKCWGRNDLGQLGNNSTTNSLTPVAVSGLGSGVVAITVGFRHSCALINGGAVKCWGSNRFGQLGNNSTTNSLTPVPVSGLSTGVVAITAGYGHTCAQASGGGVKCWGWNAYGQLGNNNTTNSWTPVAVSGLSSGVVAITGGDSHNCALTSGGAVTCWGWNYSGQLGNNSSTDSSIPVAVSGLSSGIGAFTAGYEHTCALTSGGELKCWGYNGQGQLGNNTTANSSIPLSVMGL